MHNDAFADTPEVRELALTALGEITEAKFVGGFHDTVDLGDGVYSLRFESKAPGFHDWWWSVSVTQVDDETAPTVLECGMLPAEDALLAPEWVPWAKRLAEFRETHDAKGNLLEESDGEGAAGGEQPEATIRIRKRTRTRKRRRSTDGQPVDGPPATEQPVDDEGEG